MIKKWIKATADESIVSMLKDNTGLADFICKIMAARGIDTIEKADNFLGDDYSFQDPFLLKDMDKAVERIQTAIDSAEKICVYGDYDCDGITSTALLTSYLQSVGADVFYYIPSRDTEGYGMNKSAMDTISQMNANLIITVDNGISAHEEIDYAKELGIDVVVTDHHTPRDTLPNAPVVNPHREDCPSTYKDLAGVGVAFTLVCALENAEADELLEHYGDLLAIGTIADIVPLTGENRAFVKKGLSLLSESSRPGINAIMQSAGIEASCGQMLASRSVSFGVAPRINAAGRISSVDEVVELLLTEDITYALNLAEELESLNRERKQIEDRILKEIERKITKNPQLLNRRVLLLSGRGWHHGVIGIVASRILERYGKPCILFSVEGDEARGSGRSIEEFSLIEAISACSELLTRYGGHKQAVGLTIPVSALGEFGERIEDFCSQNYPVMPINTLNIDCDIEISALNVQEISTLQQLEPFGAGNNSPVFGIYGIKIADVASSKDGKHTRLVLSKGNSQITAMYFRVPPGEFPYKTGDIVDVAITADINEFRGATQVSVAIKEIKPADFESKEILEQYEIYSRHLRAEYSDEAKTKLLPTREENAAVYKLVAGRGQVYTQAEYVYCALNKQVEYAKILIIFDVFTELGLAQKGYGIRIIPNAPKADLDKSPILTGLKVN